MIQPYYQNQNVVLYKGDCLQILPQLDIKVDCVITDLPYGTSACKWDCIVPFQPMWKQLQRLTKDNSAICLFGVQPFSSLLRVSNLNLYKYDWIWNKGQFANFLNVKFQPGKVHQIISVFGKGASSYSKNINMNYFPVMQSGKPYKCKSGNQKQQKNNSTVRSKIQSVITQNDGKRYPTSILNDFKKDKQKYHPTQKPISLLEYLIKTYSEQNDLILDFTCGSGGVGIACMNTNRRCVLIQKQQKYCQITVKRLKELQKQKQESLF